MLTDEYLEIIEKSVEPVRDLLPGSSKLLFTTLFEKKELPPTCAEEPILSVANEDVLNSDLSGRYLECYSLVSGPVDTSGKFEVVKKELMFEVFEFGELLDYRKNTVKNWMSLNDEGRDDYFCDYFIEEILPDGWRVFIPNRVPAKYSSPDDDYAFISIF